MSDPTVTELQQESARLESAIGGLERTLADLRASLGTVRAELAKRMRASPEPRCSEHALLRYIERTRGIDVEAIRSEIMTPGIVEALRSGVTAITVNNVKFVCKDGVVVTVVTDDMRNGGKHKRPPRFHENDDTEWVA